MVTMQEWLENSPLPIVCRIINNADDLRAIVRSAAIYDKQTLLIIPIETLEQLIKSISKS